MLRRSEAAALVWGDIEFRADGTARVTVRRSKTDQEGTGAGGPPNACPHSMPGAELAGQRRRRQVLRALGASRAPREPPWRLRRPVGQEVGEGPAREGLLEGSECALLEALKADPGQRVPALQPSRGAQTLPPAASAARTLA